MDSSSTMFRGLARRWPMIVLTVVVAVLVAYAFAQSQPDEYRSTTRLLVGPTTGAPVETLRSAGLMAHTYGDVVLSQSNLRAAAEAAGLPGDLEELTDMVEVRANETTRTLTVIVEHDDPQVGAAFASALIDRVIMTAPPPTAVFYPSVETEVPAGMVTLLDDANANPPEPVERPTLLLVLLAGVVAAGMAATVAVGLESAPWRRPPSNLDGLVQRRFLGRVVLPPGGTAGKLVGRRTRREAERDHRLLTTKVQHLTADTPLASLAVFGARANDGSALVAAELATAFARAGRSVVLVDLTSDTALADRLHLSRVEREVVTVDDIVLELADVEAGEAAELRMLVSDAVRASGEPARVRHVVDLLSEVADLVVVIAPAMLLEYGTLLVAKRADGALLVGGEDAGSVDGVIEAYDVLLAHDVRILGTVLASQHGAADYPSFGSGGTPVTKGPSGQRPVEQPSDLAPRR